jgi:predicted ester cyclase
MALEDNKVIVHQFIKTVWNEGSLDRIAEFISLSYAIPGGGSGPTGVRDNVQRFRAAFPDIVVQISHTVAEDDVVVTWLNLEGTNSGPFKNYPPSHSRVKWWEVAFWWIQNGMIVRGQFAADMLALRQGIGAIPPLAQERWSGDADPATVVDVDGSTAR